MRRSLRPRGDGGGDDGNVDWQTDEPSDANGCDFITEEGGCGRIYGSGGERASEIAVGNDSGLLSGYWGQSDGSGIGMRNGMRMQQIAELRGFAARQQLKDELAYYRDGMGMSCQASGNAGTCGFKASNKSIQQAMSGAFALARGLDIAGEGIAVVTPLGDGVEIVDAIVEGDDAALAMAVGMAVVGLVPGVKGAKAAKKIADVADGAHDAAKAADALGGAAKAAKGGLPNSATVARGGANITPESIVKGTGTHPSGVTGFSAECAGGNCLRELGNWIRHNKMGTTTVGDIRAAGGQVVKISGRSPDHVTVTGLDPSDASRLLSPSVPNPVPKAERAIFK